MPDSQQTKEDQRSPCVSSHCVGSDVNKENRQYKISHDWLIDIQDPDSVHKLIVKGRGHTEPEPAHRINIMRATTLIPIIVMLPS